MTKKEKAVSAHMKVSRICLLFLNNVIYFFLPVREHLNILTAMLCFYW